MLLLNQDINRKKQIDKNNTTELDINDNKSKEYKLEAVQNSLIHRMELELDYLSKLYNLVF